MIGRCRGSAQSRAASRSALASSYVAGFPSRETVSFGPYSVPPDRWSIASAVKPAAASLGAIVAYSALLEPAWWKSRMMPFGCLASYTKPDIETPSCACRVTGPGLTLACALADNQNASTIVAPFSHFSDILRLLFSSRFGDRVVDSFASSRVLLRLRLSWALLLISLSIRRSRPDQRARGSNGPCAASLPQNRGSCTTCPAPGSPGTGALRRDRAREHGGRAAAWSTIRADNPVPWPSGTTAMSTRLSLPA